MTARRPAAAIAGLVTGRNGEPAGELHLTVEPLPAIVREKVVAAVSDQGMALDEALHAALLGLLWRYTDDSAPSISVVEGTALGESAVALTPDATLLELTHHLEHRPGRQDGPPVAIELGAARVPPVDELFVDIGVDLDRSELWVAHDPALLDDVGARDLLGHFERLLAGLAGSPGARIGGIPVIGDEERELQLVAWNQTAAPTPARPVTRLIEEVACAHGNSVAVGSRGVALTYEELDGRANQLARHLRDSGVGADCIVAVCVDRSVELLVALLGILKSGGAYLPLDPTYPVERLVYMLEDSGTGVLVTDGSAPDQLPVAHRVHLSDDAAAIASQSLAPLDHAPSASDLAYVIYTSGSTGWPKGVAIEHRSLSNLLASLLVEPGLRSDDVLLAVTTPSFDIHIVELFLPLLAGARVEIATREIAANGPLLSRAIDEVGATVLQATPATWKMVVQSGWPGDGRITAFSGGEPMSLALMEQLLERCGAVWNLYGPTETTVWSTVARITVPESPAPIGRPIANTSLYILDAAGEPVPIGATGELYIGGEGLARGYLHRPELTAERFVPDPFTTDPQRRMYRTGDVARYRADATVEVLGRLDHQVKIRGHRIELGEVESVLCRHPDVGDAVVVAGTDRYGDADLFAYVVLAGGAVPTPADLRRFLTARLPSFMVPSAVVVLTTLPLTANGKVDRKALPDPTARDVIGSEHVAPRDETEAQLVEIWERVLGIAPISVTDSFFDLGVSSLMAARLFAEIQDLFGRDLPLAPIFQAPTVEQLAQLLAGERAPLPWRCLVPLRTSGSRPPVFAPHASAGAVYHLRELADALGEDQPFYALQAENLYGGALTRKPTIESMARRYLDEVRQVQPRGPYVLIGYCFAAPVVYEMAQQLLADGEEVGLLAVLNGPTLPYRQRFHSWPGVSHAEEPPPPQSPTRTGVRRRVRALKRRGRLRLERAAVRWLDATGLDVPASLRTRYLNLVHDRAEAAYHLRPYPSPMLVLAGEGLYPTDDLGWSEIVSSDVTTAVVPSPNRRRRDCLRAPNVEETARILRDAIDRASSRTQMGAR